MFKSIARQYYPTKIQDTFVILQFASQNKQITIMSSKVIKDLQTYAVLLESSIYDLYKAQKINNPSKKCSLYSVRKNTIKTNQESLLFAFISEVRQNKHSIYPPLIELIQSETTYYLSFQLFNLMLDITMSKGYKDNYLYNITKRKQYIDDLRNIAEHCDYALTSVNMVIDDNHIYCLPAYNSPKGNFHQTNRHLIIGLIYSLITGNKLPEDNSKIPDNGKNLVKLLLTNYNSPHLDSIIHQNFERDQQQIQFNSLGVNNQLKNLAKNLDNRRSHVPNSEYPMNFDDFSPNMLLEDQKQHKNVISGRVSTIIDDANYPRIDQYQPFIKNNAQKNSSQYPVFQTLTKNQIPPEKGNLNLREDKNTIKKPQLSNNIYPYVDVITNNATNQQQNIHTNNYGNHLKNVAQDKKLQQDKTPIQHAYQNHQSQEVLYNHGIELPYSQKNKIQSMVQPSNQINNFSKQKLKYLQNPPVQLKKQLTVNKIQNHYIQPQIPPKNMHPNHGQMKKPLIQTKHPMSHQQPKQNKSYIASRAPIQNRLTHNPKKDETNHILTSVTGFISAAKTNQKSSVSVKKQKLQSTFRPEDNSPDKLFQFALQNYFGQFKLFSKLIRSFLTYYITSNLGRVASYMLARSCVNRKLRLINALIKGQDVFELGPIVMKNIDISKYIQRIQKTVYNQDPEQFKLLINFKSITPETYNILKPYLGEIDELDKTQELCFYYMYSLSKRDPQKDLHHLMLYDALYVLHTRSFDFVYDYKQMPKQWNQQYARDKMQLIDLLAIKI